MQKFQNYTIEVDPPQKDSELWGAWCKELSLSAFGETESEAFYNLIENIPVYFEIKNEKGRAERLCSQKTNPQKKTFTIPAFA